jgi:hypothetical protein
MPIMQDAGFRIQDDDDTQVLSTRVVLDAPGFDDVQKFRFRRSRGPSMT